MVIFFIIFIMKSIVLLPISNILLNFIEKIVFITKQ